MKTGGDISTSRQGSQPERCHFRPPFCLRSSRAGFKNCVKYGILRVCMHAFSSPEPPGPLSRQCLGTRSSWLGGEGGSGDENGVYVLMLMSPVFSLAYPVYACLMLMLFAVLCHEVKTWIAKM